VKNVQNTQKSKKKQKIEKKIEFLKNLTKSQISLEAISN